MLVRRRIQTPSVANGPERGSTEGEVVLGASPPARLTLANTLAALGAFARVRVATRFGAVDAGMNPASPRAASARSFGGGQLLS